MNGAKAMNGVKALVVGSAASLLMVLAPGLAHASGPSVERYRDSGSFVDSTLCGFRIHVAYQDIGRIYRWFDADGNLVLFVKHTDVWRVALLNDKRDIRVEC